MNKIPLRVRRIHVREAPGIGSGLDPLDDLSPGINVIYGPNGSGKSTTLRLMQASLSPGIRASNLRCRGDRVETVVDLSGSESTVVLRDLETVSTEAGIPAVGSELVRDCRFSLKELMEAAAGGQYGKLFNEAAAGGLDLVQVAKSQGMEDRGKPRPTDRKELSALRRKLTEAENEVEKLIDEKRHLTELESESFRLQSNCDRLQVLRDAIRHRGVLSDLDRASELLAEYPSCMDQLIGDELEILSNSTSQLATEEENLRRARRDWRSAIRSRWESGLTNQVTPGLFMYFDWKKENLDGLEQDLQEIESSRIEADAAMQTAHELLGNQVPPDLLKAADAPLLAQLEGWCDRVEENQGKAAAVAELKQDLGDLSPVPASSAAEDIQLLRDWLAADRAQGGGCKLRTLLLGAAVVVLVISVVVGISVHLAGLSGILGSACLILAWFYVGRDRTEQCRQEAEERCQRSPETWTRQAVNQLLIELEHQHAAELEARQRITRWAAVLKNREAEIEEESTNLGKNAEELSKQLGFAPPLVAKCFGMVAKALIEWQTAYRKSSSLEAKSEQVAGEIESLRNEVKQKIADPRMPEIAADFDSTVLAGWISDLRANDLQFQNACRDMETSRDAVSRSLKHIRVARIQIRNVYDRIGSERADDARLRELLNRLDDFRGAKQKVNSYGEAGRQARDFFVKNQDLAQQSLEEMNREVESIGNPGEALTEVNQNIGGIRSRLQAAQRSTAVEERRSEFENQRSKRLGEREQMLASVAGKALADQVQQKVASETVPVVQRRAGELLNNFTRGACELVVENGGVRVLQKSERQLPFELDQLSDGTRVQLFIAVRLAFVEQGEQGWQLPIFFDEAFANSDDVRGRKIMDALVEIAKQGRQVFYFTSQAAEYGRWKGIFDSAGDCEHKFLPLRKGFAQPVVRAPLAPPNRYPDPVEGESYWQYAQRIGYSGNLDPWISSVDEVPIVHVLESLADLRMLLEAGIHAWGPLARLGPRECGMEGGEVAFQMARKRAEFLSGVCGLWQRGRGRPITREHLSEAGVKNTPVASRLDETWNHALSLGRDAKKLCEALEQKKISVAQLGPKTITSLRELCEEKGLIAPDAPLETGELRLRALNLGKSIGLTGDDCNRLLECFIVNGVPSAIEQ